MRLDAYNVGLIAHVAGFTDEDLVIAIAVSGAESGYDTNARYVTYDEDSRGLWQINTYAHPNFDANSLYDGMTNGYAAFDVFRDAGYRWRPWSTYNSGRYWNWMDEATAAVNKMVSVGLDVSVPAPVVQIENPPPSAPNTGLSAGGWDWTGDHREQVQQFVWSAMDHNNFADYIDSLIIS